MSRIAALGVLLFCCASVVSAGPRIIEGPDDKKKEPSGYGVNLPDEAKKALGAGGAMDPNVSDIIRTLIFCGLGILAFGVGITACVVVLLVKDKMPREHAMQAIGLVTVITVGAFLVVAGYGQTQISGMMALFGSVLGYVFGKGWKDEKASPNPTQPPAPTTPPPG